MKKSVPTKKAFRFFILILGAGICAAIAWGIWIQYPGGFPAPEKGRCDDPKSVILDVPCINQRERYPTGCESVSAVMALQYWGVDITVEEFIDNHLAMGAAPTAGKNGERTGCSPWNAFPGNPYSKSGYGCYAPVIVNAVNDLKDRRKLDVQAHYGKPIETLCRDYIDKGIPVIFWATLDMQPARTGNSWTDDASGKQIQWVAPMHCLLLIGYDDACYYFNDPWQQKAQAYPKAAVKTAYESIFAQAVVIQPAAKSK